MGTKPRILVSITLAALLVLLQVAASFWFFTQVETTAAQRKHAFETIDGANELLSALKDAETGERGYLLTGDEAFLVPYLEVRDGITGRLAGLTEGRRNAFSRES